MLTKVLPAIFILLLIQRREHRMQHRRVTWREEGVEDVEREE